MNKSLVIMIYGIGRSTGYTAKYINDFISLSKNNFERVFVVYNLLFQDKVVSSRTKEDSPIDHDDRWLINYDDINILFEENFNYSETLDIIEKKARDVYDDNFFTYGNLLKQLSMVKKFEDVDVHEFSHFCLIRDDTTIFMSDNNTSKYFSMLRNNCLITSSYYWNRGVCDRFLAGPISLLPLFLNRIEGIQHMISKGMIITGERLIKYILDSNKIKVSSLPIIIQRIRSGNVFAKERHLMPFWSLYDFFRVLKSIFIKC